MFIDFSIKDLIDILLVAYLLYQTYRLMKDSGSINIFIGILVFIGIWLIVSQVLEMKLLGSIFDKLVSVGVLALIILFRMIYAGSLSHWARINSWDVFPLPDGKQAGKDGKSGYYADCTCLYEHEQREGGGTDCHRKSVPLNDIIRTGEIINANVNQRLIENIFFKTVHYMTEP